MISRIVQFAITFVFFCSIQSFAIYPYYNEYGWLLFKSEPGEIAIKTRFKAVTGGVETWFLKYRDIIDCYVISGWYGFPYNAYLPGYGYVPVTAEKLAHTIHTDATLSLQDIEEQIITRIQSALTEDHTEQSYNEYGWGMSSGREYWDPIDDFAWRSVYMENRNYMNNESTIISANCFGTADYLARATQWSSYYNFTYPEGALSYENKFPNIFLEGDLEPLSSWIPDWAWFSLDKDLNQTTEFTLLSNSVGQYASCQGLLNAFDIIRLSNNTYNGLLIGNIELGINLHAQVYLCTDEFGSSWVFEKHNNGAPVKCPYTLNILGDCQLVNDPEIDGHIPEEIKYGGACFDKCYRGFFRRPVAKKQLYSNSSDLNWVPIIP